MTLRDRMRQRLDSNTVIDESGCWLWTGATAGQRGYGHFRIDDRDYYAHRVALELFQDRPVPKGMVVRHDCDTPRCVNPSHLKTGSVKDNANDCVVRGRTAVGVRNGQAKLSNTDVISKPILFSGPMVRAILEGRKTQTRRVVKGTSEHRGPYNPAYIEQYRRDAGWKAIAPHPVGSEMWVRETWTQDGRGGQMANGEDAVYYLADMPDPAPWKEYWKPSIFMPRWASRLTLTVKDVRVERLQDISEEDAEAEGVEIDMWDQAVVSRNYSVADPKASGSWFQSWRPDCGPVYVDVEEVARASYRTLWESINGPGSWDANPWVWVYVFEVKA